MEKYFLIPFLMFSLIAVDFSGGASAKTLNEKLAEVREARIKNQQRRKKTIVQKTIEDVGKNTADEKRRKSEKSENSAYGQKLAQPEKRAYPKTEIILSVQDIEPVYVQKRPFIEDCATPTAVGCAFQIVGYSWSIPEWWPDMTPKILDLKTVYYKIEVEISSSYPKYSCVFNAILKHELTHVAMRRRVYKQYAKELAASLLLALDVMPPPLTQYDFNKLNSIVRDFQKRADKEANFQDSLMDSPKNNGYQWEQCKEKKK